MTALVVAALTATERRRPTSARLVMRLLVGGGWVAAGVVLMASAFVARAESWFATIRAALPDRPIGRPTRLDPGSVPSAPGPVSANTYLPRP